MLIKNSLNLVNQFSSIINSKLRKIYLNSNFYNNKISKIQERTLVYKPNPYIMDCLVKYNKRKKNINEINFDEIWKNNSLPYSDYKKLHNFFWLFTLDLKSSNINTQNVIENWIDNNNQFNSKSWEIDILSKRIISWICNSKLSYEDSSIDYKKKFNFIINKQVNHLINEINISDLINDKMKGCTAIILAGLSYRDKNYLDFGLNLLNKIINNSFDENGFPKSRNFRQLVFYLKYFVLIREFLKDSQNDIPDYINESIFYLGQSYKLLWQDTKQSYLFNGSNINENFDFDKYLSQRGYKFLNNKHEAGGYAILKNKKNSLIMDIGKPPGKEFSYNYQSGPLSFEFTHMNSKIVSNSGYFQNLKHQLNILSRSTAAHSTLTINNFSVSQFEKDKYGKKLINKPFKILNKNIIVDKEAWSIEASHDGYLKQYGFIHHRKLKFYTKKLKIEGSDILTRKKNKNNINFDIRFHLDPKAKITKTLDKNTVLFGVGNAGWKFVCKNYLIDIETGLFFGKKGLYTENKNICISGKSVKDMENVVWEISKI